MDVGVLVSHQGVTSGRPLSRPYDEMVQMVQMEGDLHQRDLSAFCRTSR
jgi:hypothetical protein